MRPWRRGGDWWGVALLVAAVLAQGVAAWFPFTLDPPRVEDNAARQLPDGSLRFRDAAARALAAPPGTLDADAQRVHVHLVAVPSTTDQHGPARLVSLAENHRNADLMIGQERDRLVVRVQRRASDALGRPALEVPDVFRAGRPVELDVAVRGERLDVVVDGRPVARQALGPEPLRTWDLRFPVAFGDDPGGGRIWHGTLTAAAMTVDGERVEYTAPGAVATPEEAIWVLPDQMRAVLDAPDAGQRRRALLHLGAFVAIGGLARMVSSWRLWRLAGATLLLSLVLQAGKSVIEGRHPSLIDVAAHVLGVLLGAVLITRWRRRARAPAVGAVTAGSRPAAG